MSLATSRKSGTGEPARELAKRALPPTIPMNKVRKKSRRAKWVGRAEASFPFFTVLGSVPLRRAGRGRCWLAGPPVRAPQPPLGPAEYSAKHSSDLPIEQKLRPAHKGSADFFRLPAQLSFRARGFLPGIFSDSPISDRD